MFHAESRLLAKRPPHEIYFAEIIDLIAILNFRRDLMQNRWADETGLTIGQCEMNSD